jgi:hypothetical protein
MEQSPSSETNSLSANQEILRPLWNPKIPYNVHKDTSLAPILSQMHSFHTFPPYFPKIHVNIIFPSKPRLSKWSLPFRISNQNIVCISHFFHP